MELIKSTKFKEDEINMPMWSKSWILFAYQNTAKFNSVGNTHPDLSLKFKVSYIFVLSFQIILVIEKFAFVVVEKLTLFGKFTFLGGPV